MGLEGAGRTFCTRVGAGPAGVLGLDGGGGAGARGSSTAAWGGREAAWGRNSCESKAVDVGTQGRKRWLMPRQLMGIMPYFTGAGAGAGCASWNMEAMPSSLT